MSRLEPETNTTKLKPKNKATKTASLDAIIQLAPMAGEIGEALMYGTSALGTGAVGVMGNKARKMMKKHDEEYRKSSKSEFRNGGKVSLGDFKGSF